MTVLIYPDEVYSKEHLKSLRARVKFGPIVKDGRDDTFCVPSAISIVTGLARGVVAAMVFLARKKGERPSTGQKLTLVDGKVVDKYASVRGVSRCHYDQVLKSLGLPVDWVLPSKWNHDKHRMDHLSIHRFARENMIPGVVYLVCSNTHMFVMKDGMVMDNSYKCFSGPVSTRIFGSRTRVQSYLALGKVEDDQP